MANQSKRGGGASAPARGDGRANLRSTAASGVVGEKPASSPLGGDASDEVTRPTTTGHVQPRRAERRPEMIRQQREARRQVYEKRRRQWLLTRIGLTAFGVLAVAGIAFFLYSFVQDRRENRTPEGTVSFNYAGSTHTGGLEETVEYTENPPVGGTHAPAPYWQNCGYYDAPIQNETGVHSMEHGAVWITYRPDLPQDQIDKLRDRADDNSFILVSPDTDLPAPVVASSWNRQVVLDSADDVRLGQFIRRFRKSPDAPEPQGVCTGGVGDPL